MILLMISIVLIIISIILIIKSTQDIKHINKINKDIEKQNNDLEKLNSNLLQKQQALNNNINDKQKQLSDIQTNISEVTENQKKLSQEAYENYCEILENKYKEIEEEYDMEVDALQTAYSNLQLKFMREADEVKEELDKLKATRAAAIQAQLKEKEIEEDLSFYCLKISDNEIKDITVLESVKSKLINPRILSMLIWKTYFQKPMTSLCNNIIGTEIKCGIYKITNQLTKECYIGQAVDLATRWKNHAKCGLGIDTPAGNKLYKAIQEYSIWNFSWEILEECSREQLNEKEKYYIELYNAYNFGYNSNMGVSK